MRNIPMPKLFLQAVVRNADTYRVVIDGQQRIKAILSFLHDEYPLCEPYRGEHLGMRFTELPAGVQEQILSYRIDVNEIRNAPENVVRDIYSRVNKYTVALNKQELRRADYPGDFLNLSEQLAEESFFEDARIFTVANSKRMGDVEYISELLALLLEGPQEKKETLDSFYLRFSDWDVTARNLVVDRFRAILRDLDLIFSTDALPLAKSRFRQKADFYSLFGAVNDFHIAGQTLVPTCVCLLRKDLDFLDKNIEPQSDVKLLSEYAVKCVSQGNTLASRVWRKDFLKHFLHSSYFQAPPPVVGINMFRSILVDVFVGDGMCPPQMLECPVCHAEFNDYLNEETAFLTWQRGCESFQCLNATFVHVSCVELARSAFFVPTEFSV